MQHRLLVTAGILLPIALAVAYLRSSNMSAAAASVAAIIPTSTPLSFVLFGATGRTGIPFMHQAIARGHRITAFTRSANRIPAELANHPNLTTVEVQLDQSAVITEAMAKAKPDVVYAMLASDPAPHTAVSTGTRAAHNALRSMREAAIQSGDSTQPQKATPLIVITAWGVGPTRPLLRRWYERTLVSLAVNTFYAPVMRDFDLMLAQLEAPTADGVIQPIQLMPPLLTNGPLTAKHEFGDALTEMKDKMRVYDTISRASMAHVALLLGEKAAAGEAVPSHVALRQN